MTILVKLMQWAGSSRRGRQVLWKLSQAGWPFAVGAGLLVFAGVFHVAGLMPAEHSLQELRSDVAAERSLLARQAQERSKAAKTMNGPGAFPPESARESLLQRVHAAAEARGVTIASAEYRQIREGRLLRVEFILPVKAAYPQLRAWLADIMNGMPALALEEFSLHRDVAANPLVEGRVRLSLFLEAH